jgi:hypothetical protein
LINLNAENNLLANQSAINLRIAGTGFGRTLWYTSTVIRSLCASYAADPTQSKATIENILNDARQGKSGDELEFLAEEVVSLGGYDFEVAEAIYKTAFGGFESSDEPVVLGGSGQFNLTTTRRQVHNHSKYQLIKRFPALFAIDTNRTLRLLITLVEQEVHREHRRSDEKSESWTADGITFQLIEDGSRYWEEYDTTYGVIALIRAIEKEIIALANNPATLKHAVDFVRLLMREGQHAVLWRMVLRLCSHDALFDSGLGIEVCSMEPLSRHMDTIPVLQDCVIDRFTGLSPEAKEKIELAIISAYENAPDYEKTAICDVLLGLSSKGLQSQAAWNIVERTKVEPAEAWPSSSSSGSPLIPAPALPAHIDEALRCLESIGRNLNGTLTLEESQDALMHVDLLFRFAESDPGIDEGLLLSVRRVLASAGRIIAPTIAQSDLPFNVLRDALIFAAEDPTPKASDSDDEFNFGTRSDAASGIISLAFRNDAVDDKTIAVIQQLANDKSGTVRSSILEKSIHLYHNSREVMNELLIRSTLRERNAQVLLSVMFQLHRLKTVEPSCVCALTRIILRRLRNRSDRDSEEVRHYGATVLMPLGLEMNDQAAQQCLDLFVSNPLKFRKECTTVVANLENGFAMHVEKSDNVEPELVRKRTIDLAKKATIAMRKELVILEATLKNTATPSEEVVHAVSHLGDSALYLTQSIEHAIERLRENGESQDALRELLNLLDEVISDLCEIGINQAASKFIDTFSLLITVDPERVFIWLSRCIAASMPYGYLNDRLAADDVMKILRLFLADYRHVFQSNKAAREALVKIFEAMVGWPEAWQLAYEMDDLFR